MVASTRPCLMVGSPRRCGVSTETAREWLSVDIDGATWMFDLTFLASSWQCIFGAGCQGVLAEPAEVLGEGCCSYGAHTADEADRERVRVATGRLDETMWCNHGVALDGLFASSDGGLTTVLVNEVCVFHNPPDFEGGHGCALHIGAVAAGERPLDWKPEVCWQVPLRLEHHVDDNGHDTYFLREWQRRDWGHDGQALHWWCTEDPNSFGGHEPVLVHMADEIVAMVGEEPYAALLAHLRSRPDRQPLEHRVELRVGRAPQVRTECAD